MKRAFTLIELLIVIAIIAILALIALPNFLEAQVRARVSRAKADMRSFAMAIEAYTTDNTRPPLGYYTITRSGLCLGDSDYLKNNIADIDGYSQARLTTPIAYMTSFMMDPFLDRGSVRQTSGGGTPGYSASSPAGEPLKLYDYTCAAWREDTSESYSADKKLAWAMGYVWSTRSFGPSRTLSYNEEPYRTITGRGSGAKLYDPTNGTLSKGHLIRTNKGEYGGTPGS